MHLAGPEKPSPFQHGTSHSSNFAFKPSFVPQILLIKLYTRLSGTSNTAFASLVPRILLVRALPKLLGVTVRGQPNDSCRMWGK